MPGTEALIRGGYSPLLAMMLAARGLYEPRTARAFLEGGEETLHDPLLLPDMENAAARIRRAIAERETVAVFGDYDVDGIAATCLVTDWLRRKGLICQPYIPDRIGEGYGLNCAAMDTIHSLGATLVITVDCGITAIEESAYAASLGMDMIITDHHECGASALPSAIAVVDPKRPDSAYPDDGLAGVGVAFKLICAVEGNSAPVLDSYADLIATATVADVMPLLGENRYIVRRGLAKLNAGGRAGLRALLEEAGISGRRIGASTLGFSLAPRINAAGRLGRADVALRLLLTEDENEATELAIELCRLNRERQAIEQEIWFQARAMLESQPPDAPIVLAAEGWHQGVIGIAASRLAENYSLPAVMICLDGERGKGSCRSFGGYNLYDALSACSDCLEGFGGHALAAGLTIRRDRVDDFRRALAAHWRSCDTRPENILECDLIISSPALLSMDCVESLDALEPYGPGNARPTLCITDTVIERIMPMGGGRHLRLLLSKGGICMECVFFSKRESELGFKLGDRVDAAFYPQINEFRGRRTVQLNIIDLRATNVMPTCMDALFGIEPDPWTAANLCPERADFVISWRWLQGKGGAVSCVAEELRDWGPAGMHPAKFLVCLGIMRDEGLISLEVSDGRLTVRALEREGKADLDNSPRLIHMRALRDRIASGRF